MSVRNYEELLPHIGHDIVCVGYGLPGEVPTNVAIECETCNVVLVDYDHPDDPEGLGCTGCGMKDPGGIHFSDCTLLEPGDLLVSRTGEWEWDEATLPVYIGPNLLDPEE